MATMAHTATLWLSLVCFGLVAVGCLYALGAAVVVRQFFGGTHPSTDVFPGVSVLKPLHGADAGLYDDLASFCEQDYRGPVQILLGIQNAADPAIAVAQRLTEQWPGRDIEIVQRSSPTGPNPKIANVIGLEPRVSHDVVILSDADIGVASDYLRNVVATLRLANVGAVTCLYRGVARGGLWARLASMGIDYHFLPNVLMGLRLRLARPCLGSTIALRRDTLAAIGGLGAFIDRIADDYAIGEAVRARGLDVAVPSFVLTHACTERNAAELLRHELRWARTVRAVNPYGYAGSVVTYPLAFALPGALLTGFGVVGLTAIVAAISCRLVLQLQVDHTLQVTSDRWWLGPARDLLAFAVYAQSFFVDVVNWRGLRYKVRADGTMRAVGRPKT
jgi:ceramide glucosyltransferase